MRTPTIAFYGFLAGTLLMAACSSIRHVEESATDVLRFSLETSGPAVEDAASTGGVSWVDYDGDGDLDLFVTNGYDVSAETPVPQANRLYRNDGHGKLEPVVDSVLGKDEGFSSGSTWGDHDNDGDLDVFVANQQDQNNLLYRNEGGGAFTRITEGAPVGDGGHSYAAAWIDVDSDGALDLFVANGGLSHSGANFLYRNRGDGSFEKVVEGEIVTDEASSCGFAWGDYDDDGDPDLFVANLGFNPATNNNALYRNEGDWVFSKITNEPVVEDHQPSSSANWVDYDGDGDLDLHVANLYGLANLLYRNDGAGRLEPVSHEPVTVDGGYSHASNWEDYDNDGDLDLFVANWGSAPDLYLNDGLGGLERERAGDVGRFIDFAGSVASGDHDGDGDVDVYVGNWPNSPGPGELNRLFVNRGVTGHWLQVRLEGTRSNRAGIGARITVVTHVHGERRIQVREVHAHNGFRSQSSLVQHFGLGDAETVTEVRVRWPSGEHSRLANVEPNQRIIITE